MLVACVATQRNLKPSEVTLVHLAFPPYNPYPLSVSKSEPGFAKRYKSLILGNPSGNLWIVPQEIAGESPVETNFLVCIIEILDYFLLGTSGFFPGGFTAFKML